MTAHDSTDQALMAALVVGLAAVVLVDVGSSGAVLIGLASTLILVWLVQRR